MPTITIRGDNRVFFTGKTGSGKTFMARWLALPLDRLIVFDSKATLTNWNTEPWSDDAAQRMIKGGDGRLRILAPDDGNFDEYLDSIWRMRNVTVYIDEVYAMIPPRKNIPSKINRIYTRGREFGIGIWAATQRPMNIPMVMISEAEWIFEFRLQLVADRARIAEFMGPDALIPVRDSHGFYVYNQEWDRPLYKSELQVRKVQ